MSTQRFMSRLGKNPGRFIVGILVGALLALQCLLPPLAFARPGGSSAAAFSASTQQENYVRDRVGVSVVRLVVTYGNGSVVCTGLGTLLGSTLISGAGSLTPVYQNWVLTDANLVRAELSTCGVQGLEDGNQPLKEIQIWANDEYAHTNNGLQLDDLTDCGQRNTGALPVPESSIAECTDGQSPISAKSILTFPANRDPYLLFSFESKSGEPYLTLNPDFNSTHTSSYNVGLTNSSRKVFPSADATGTQAPSPQSYLTPNIVEYTVGVVPPVSAQGSATASLATPTSSAAPLNAIESGTPQVDANGELVGMLVNSENGPTSLGTSFLQTIANTHILPSAPPPVKSPSACSDGIHVAPCWNAGIDAYYGAPALKSPQYTLARSYFGKMSVLNPQFKAPQTFDTQAEQALKKVPTPPSAPSSSNFLAWLPLVGLGSGLVVLILLLILVTLLTGRARRRRRAELERFANEQLVAKRQAAEEVQRQRGQPPQATEELCPNCHQPVEPGDTVCPSCHFPLVPSASGLSPRRAGNAPQPPVAPVISEQPTIQFPPVPTKTPKNGGETTVRRKKPVPEEETVYNLQQARGRSLSLAVGTRSDPGIKRKHKPNEDSLFAMQGARTHNSLPQQFGLFVVADGMGGHANGQDASRLAIQTMIDFMLPRVATSEQAEDQAFLKLLGDGVQNANEAVHNRNLEAHGDMGTTMTTALVMGATAYVANVGDSRTYLYREGQGLSKVTNDHSVVASLVEAGIIQPDDIYTHPKRNQIYRSLGEKPVVEVDTFKVELQPGDKLLLCSDGLWDMVRDPLIQNVLSKTNNDPNELGQELIKAALDGGGEDNVTVIIAQFAETNEHSGLTGVHLLAKPESVTVPNLPPM